MLSRLSIFHKTLITPILALLLFGAYMVYVYVQYLHSREVFDRVREEHFPILQIADENLLLLETLKKSFQDAIAADEPSWFKHAEASKNKIERNLDLLQVFRSLQEAESLKTQKIALSRFYTLSLKVADQLMQEHEGYDDGVSSAFEASRKACDSAFGSFKMAQISAFNAMIDETSDQRRRVVLMGLFLGVFSLSTIIIVTMILSLRTRHSLNALLESVQDMADGNPDFSRRLKHDSYDELGTLVSQFNRFTEKLEADHNELQKAKKELETANAKLEMLSTTDGLTGIYNRRYFNELLERLWHEKMRSQTPLALIMMDIDFFKKFNDHYGHQRGDACLQQVVKAIDATLHRATDTLCRYGGEEFSILIEGDADEAVRIAETAIHAVRALDMEHTPSPFGKVTVSMGIAAAVPAQHSNPQALLQAADEALYESKATGRNRFTLSKA